MLDRCSLSFHWFECITCWSHIYKVRNICTNALNALLYSIIQRQIRERERERERVVCTGCLKVNLQDK